MRPSFTKPTNRPLIVPVLTDAHIGECVATIRNAIYDGAEGFAIHLCRLDRSHHNIDDLRRIIAYTACRPVLTINYRRADRPDVTDEDLVAVQMLAVEAGSSICDIMGDMFDPSPMELSRNPEVIDRQKKLVDRIHSMGGEVLMSSHTWVFMTAEQTIEHAKALESRGADMVKIAMCAHTEDEMLEVIRTTVLLKRELKVPYLHVCMGQHGKLHRVIAPMLGSAFVLCVQEYTTAGHREQPLLRSTRAVYNNLDWSIARNEILGTCMTKS